MSGITGKGVPPNQPPWLLYVKIAIIALSLVIMALAAWSLSIFNAYAGFVGYSGGVGGLIIFVVIKTWLIYGILLFMELKAPQMFYRLIAIVGYAVSIIFWLSAWAWAASTAGFWLSYFCGVDFCEDGPWKSEGSALAACAGLGAVVWILSIVHLVFFIRACMADRSTAANQAELGQFNGQHKVEPTGYPVGAAPVQYQGQPVAYQQYPQAGYQQPQAAYQQPQTTYQQPQPYATQ